MLVLDHGEIVERGTHDSLMEKHGRYYDLYMSQFRREGQEEAESTEYALDRGDGRTPQPATVTAG